MVSPKIIIEWLNKADEDFNFANANFLENSTFYAQICFHFHQAAEKYLKTFIVAHDLEFEKTHNLISLQKLCLKKETALTSITKECEILNASYIDTRYPVHWPTNYSHDKASKSREAAQKIGEIIKVTLKEKGLLPDTSENQVDDTPLPPIE